MKQREEISCKLLEQVMKVDLKTFLKDVNFLSYSYTKGKNSCKAGTKLRKFFVKVVAKLSYF